MSKHEIELEAVKRSGAGRPHGTGKYGEATTVMRVPVSDKPVILDFLRTRRAPSGAHALPESAMLPASAPLQVRVPLFGSRIPAGFPSPADDYIETELDFNELLIKNPPATYSLRVEGSSMTGAGIFDGDIIVVDKSIEPQHGHVVVAEYEGRYTIKRLYMKSGKVRLLPENPDPDYKIIEFKDEQELVVSGVVTNVIHPIK
jgi:DNA polymerase V